MGDLLRHPVLQHQQSFCAPRCDRQHLAGDVERLWRSVKCEEVYLRAYGSVGEARASISQYLAFYNRKRPHSSLDARTPDQAYFGHLPQIAAA